MKLILILLLVGGCLARDCSNHKDIDSCVADNNPKTATGCAWCSYDSKCKQYLTCLADQPECKSELYYGETLPSCPYNGIQIIIFSCIMVGLIVINILVLVFMKDANLPVLVPTDSIIDASNPSSP